MTQSKVNIKYSLEIWKDSWKFIEGYRGVMLAVVFFFFVVNIIPPIFLGGSNGLLKILKLDGTIVSVLVEVVGSFIGSVLRVAIAVGAYKMLEGLRKNKTFVFDRIFEGFSLDVLKKMFPWIIVVSVISIAVGLTNQDGPQADPSTMGLIVALISFSFYFISMFVIPLMCLEDLGIGAAFKGSLLGFLKNIPFFIAYILGLSFITVFTLTLGLFVFFYLNLVMNFLLFEKIFRSNYLDSGLGPNQNAEPSADESLGAVVKKDTNLSYIGSEQDESRKGEHS
ncbi:MAG: hypothetical protein KDD61_11740 [Bdellovibrionales bacterium]|nr:hypothetical protein [Bdellovibrionales bacterium]